MCMEGNLDSNVGYIQQLWHMNSQQHNQSSHSIHNSVQSEPHNSHLICVLISDPGSFFLQQVAVAFVLKFILWASTEKWDEYLCDSRRFLTWLLWVSDSRSMWGEQIITNHILIIVRVNTFSSQKVTGLIYDPIFLIVTDLCEGKYMSRVAP